jgi:hypothetical protein
MKKIKLGCIFFILICCSKKELTYNDLELDILNDTLIAYSFEMEKDTVNVLNYSIQNNSNKIFYFKQGEGNDYLSNKLYKNGIFIGINETNYKEVSCSNKFPFEHNNKSKCDSCSSLLNLMTIVKDTERLKESIKGGYYHTRDKRHYFFIHPGEKLFFKQYINLTDSMRYEDTRINYAHLKKNKKYYSRFFIPSDSTDFKHELPKDILKTIEANNVKVYHGILESKNKVPVKVIE